MTDHTPNLLVTLSGQLPGNRQVVFQAGIEEKAELKEINGLLDKMRIAMDRQLAFGEIQIHQLQLEQEEKLASDHMQRIEVVDQNVQRAWLENGKRGEVRLNGNQAREAQQARANVEESKKRIARVKRLIEDCREKMAG